MSSADLAVAARRRAAPSLPRHPRRQVRAELRLVFRRRRNIAMLVVLAAIPVLIGIGAQAVHTATGGDGGPAFFGLVTGNGLFLAFAALTVCLPVFLPLAVAVVGGDAVAGEASAGTLRYLLTVPVSRRRLLLVKGDRRAGLRRRRRRRGRVTGVVCGGLLFGAARRGAALRRHRVVVGRRPAHPRRLRLRLRRPARPGRDGAVLLDADRGAGRRHGRLDRCGHRVRRARRGAAAGQHPPGAAHPPLAGLRRAAARPGPRVVAAPLAFLSLAYTAIFGSLAWARITSADITS